MAGRSLSRSAQSTDRDDRNLAKEASPPSRVELTGIELPESDFGKPKPNAGLTFCQARSKRPSRKNCSERTEATAS